MSTHIRALVPLTGTHPQAIQIFQAAPQFAHNLHTRSLTTRLWKKYSRLNNWPSVSKSNLLGCTNRRATGPAVAVPIHSHISRWAATSDLTGAMSSHGLSVTRRPHDLSRDVMR